MPRRSSGRSASRPAPRPAPARSPPPQPAHHAPPPAPAQSGSGGSLLGGIGSTIAQGMAFGTGSAVAHRAVDAVMGPRTIQHETVVSEAAAAPAPATTSNSLAGTDSCSIHYKAFQDFKRLKSKFRIATPLSIPLLQCLNSYGSELSKCQFYMDMLTECRKNTGSMLGA
ncbi:coiled-coil-helix-coiled-coil-helix domain-containing protein 10, mitochondrial-like [Gossypium australe]|uniref:Coiled-coil-helix-coiled-coil-helix domain-containing protein 10, mitochondrial-like n=1 Tax=Gossypium australe TaxID=47621 RepID=A0A5B6X353_9ROSI|nr:coiled-coil-helix-coiled-coil-helix domain-containing protein 10, mitochondrial-like [Gossypium australe]